jgi:preprotein translocase SecE subunit
MAASSTTAPARGRFTVHKPGEGTVVRLGLFVLGLTFAVFTAYHWYHYCILLQKALLRLLGVFKAEFLLSWSVGPAREYVKGVGAVVLLLALLFLSYHYIYCHPKSAEFLVQTDGEMKKVNWPAVAPWFRPSTQVWGSAYVVLMVVVFLSLYVFGVDSLLGWLSQMTFYN